MTNGIKRFAIFLAKEAGAMVKAEQRNLLRSSYLKKSAKEVVTKADLNANAWILSQIKKRFPLHDLVSEEAKAEDNEETTQWIVDPIDGTTNYLLHLPVYAVSIGVREKFETTLGVTYAPALNQLFVGEKGKGATMNGRQMKLSLIANLRDAIVDFGHPHSLAGIRRALRAQIKVSPMIQSGRYLGSACLSLAYVAAGLMEGTFLVGPHNPWDVEAGALMVREAGGKVTDLRGRDWRLGMRELVATNGKIHVQLLKAFSA